MSLVPTTILKAIKKLPQSKEFHKFEGRLSTYAWLQAFVDNTNLLVPKTTLETARKAPTHPVEIPVMNKYDATLIDTRACEHDSDEVTTALVPLTWETTGFQIKEYQGGVYAENYFTKEEHFQHQLVMGLKAALEKLETDIDSYLETNKSAVNVSPLFGDLVGGAKQIEWEKRDRFYKSIPSILRRNDLGAAQILDFTNPEAEILYSYLQHQGPANGENLRYQTAPVIPYQSNFATLGAGVSETHFLAPQGSVGMLTWNSWSERNNDRKDEGEYFTTVVDPIFNLTWGLKVITQCEDESATYAGHTAGITRKYAFVLDYSFLRPYSSDTSTPILKYEVLDEPASV